MEEDDEVTEDADVLEETPILFPVSEESERSFNGESESCLCRILPWLSERSYVHTGWTSYFHSK